MKSTEGNRKKFSTLALKHFSALKRFAVSLCKSSYDADDLVSETLLKAFDNFSQLKDEAKIRQWLFRILHNQFINNFRRDKKYIDLETSTNEYAEYDSEEFSLFEALAKSNFVEAGNPEKEFISQLTHKQIDKAVSELPGEFHDAIVLCDIEDLSYAEISHILNVPLGTVRSRIARGRNILQRKLWLQATELGIHISKLPKEKAGYTCTCGKEDEKTERNTVGNLI